MQSTAAGPEPAMFFRDRRPLRGELLGPEGLSARARAVAAASAKVVYGGGRRLLDMAVVDAKSLRGWHKALSSELAARRPPAGVAEWLYDNFHIVEEALREIETD